jgi:TolA-binding protein
MTPDRVLAILGPMRRRPLRTALPLAAAAAAALLTPGCFLTRAVGLGPDPDPAEPRSGDAADVLYEKGRAYFGQKQWKSAGECFGRVWRDFPQSPFAADARFYEAECRYGMGKWNAAFEFYQGFLKSQPLSPHAPLIERRLYDMGVFVAQDGRTGFFDTSGEGIAMLEYLTQAFPNGDLADDALLFVADHEWRARRPEDAVARLHDLVDRYPGSEWAYEARLRLAKAYRDMNRGPKYDADSLRRSAAYYRAYIELVSSDPKRAGEYAAILEEARNELRDVEETLGQKGLEESNFYLAQGKVDGARAALRNVVRDWPETRAAAEARTRLGAGGDGGK